MNHIEFAAAESAALEVSSWEKWADRVEAILGHSLDGDDFIDGYSMDAAVDAFDAGQTPIQHATVVRLRKAVIRVADRMNGVAKAEGK